MNSHVEIEVSDTGQGIPNGLPAVRVRSFPPGRRDVDARARRPRPRTGHRQQLAELHGGTITAASEGAGKGATFTLKLPVMIVHKDADAANQRLHHPAADRGSSLVEDMPRLDGTHVLAVDDEPDSLDLVRSVLEAVGARVTVASSGKAALDALARECPDVLLADIGMSHMDGLQLIRAVRQLDEPVRSLPAAALTAYARSQDRITSLASGFHMHLVKPVDPLELVVAVHSLATAARRTRSASRCYSLPKRRRLSCSPHRTDPDTAPHLLLRNRAAAGLVRGVPVARRLSNGSSPTRPRVFGRRRSCVYGRMFGALPRLFLRRSCR